MAYLREMRLRWNVPKAGREERLNIERRLFSEEEALRLTTLKHGSNWSFRLAEETKCLTDMIMALCGPIENKASILILDIVAIEREDEISPRSPVDGIARVFIPFDPWPYFVGSEEMKTEIVAQMIEIGLRRAELEWGCDFSQVLAAVSRARSLGWKSVWLIALSKSKKRTTFEAVLERGLVVSTARTEIVLPDGQMCACRYLDRDATGSNAAAIGSLERGSWVGAAFRGGAKWGVIPFELNTWPYGFPDEVFSQSASMESLSIELCSTIGEESKRDAFRMSCFFLSDMIRRLSGPIPGLDAKNMRVLCGSVDSFIDRPGSTEIDIYVQCNEGEFFEGCESDRQKIAVRAITEAVDALELEGCDCSFLRRALAAGEQLGWKNRRLWKRRRGPDRGQAEVWVERDAKQSRVLVRAFNKRGLMIASGIAFEGAANADVDSDILDSLVWDGAVVVLSSRNGFYYELDTAL